MSSSNRRIDRLALLPALFLAVPALAETSLAEDVASLMPLSLQELIRLPVTTASRQPETRDQTPAHIVVVTRQQIRERRYRNLADLLEDMPGVDFMRGTKTSQFNQFTIQGHTGPNKLVVLLDGIRISPPAGGNMAVAENFALYQAKQVEFLYGPAAALYGADAVAGVINIVTERANPASESWISAGAGNFGSREISFMTSQQAGEMLSLSLGGHAQRSDRAPLQYDYPEQFRATNARTLASRLVVPAAAREDYVGDIASHSLYARADWGKNLTVGFYRTVFQNLTSTGDPPATALYLDDSRWITQMDTFYGKYRFALSDALSGEFVADYSRLQVDPRAKYVNIYNNYTPGYSYEYAERKGFEQNFNWKPDNVHRLQFGFGYQRHSAIEASSLPAPYDLAQSPSGQGYTYPNTPLPMPIYSAAFTNTSAYFNFQSEWNTRFSTMAGIRIDRHSVYGTSHNPRLGLVWRANPEHLLKVLYGESFRAPSPEETLNAFGNFDGSKDASGRYIGTSFRIPNFNLQPEKAKTLSLTWDWRPRQDLNLIANLYQSSIRNLVTTMTSTQVDAIPGALLVAPETKGNAGEQSQTGLDLITQWRQRLSPDWSMDLWGSASWVRGRIDEGNNIDWDLALVASRKVKLGTTLRYRNWLTFSPQLLWIGDTTNGRKAASPPDRLVTPGYAVANLHVGWHQLLEGRGTVWLDIRNLFDKRYFAAHGSASRTFFDMPQQPRSWMLSLEYRF